MADAPYSPTRNSFTLLRLVLAILVVLCHSYTLLGRTTPLSAATGGLMNEGTLAVDAFLAISGYLILASAARSRNFIGFLTRRVLRLLPALVCALLFSAFVVGGLAYEGTFAQYVRLDEGGPWRWVLNWLTLNVQPEQWGITGVFTGNPTTSINVSLWTIKFEVFLYLIIALLMLTTLYRRRWVYIAFFAVFLLLRLPLETFHLRLWNTGDTRFWVLSHWNYSRLCETGTFFFAGTLLYAFRKEMPRRWYMAVISLMTLVLTGLLCAAVDTEAVPLASLPWHLAWCLGLPCLVIYLGGSPLGAKFANLGDLSLGVYVFSYPIQQLIIHVNPGIPPLALFLLTLLIVLPLASLSWRCIEAPVLRLKTLRWTEFFRRKGA